MTDEPEALATAIRALPYNVMDDYDEVRRDEREKIIAALAVAYGEAEQLKRSVAEVMQEDGGCWSACSGCQESVDGYVSSRDYPYSPIFKCQPGGGCRECGGIGVIWQDGAFLASYGDALSNEPVDPAAGQKLSRFGHHPDAGIDYACEVDALISMAYDRLTGMEQHADLEERIRKAMGFRTLSTPLELRWLNRHFNGEREIYAKMPACIERIAGKIGLAHPPHPAPVDPVGGEALREALRVQTDLVGRLCDAVDREAEDIGGESSLSVLRLLGPHHAVAVAALKRPAEDQA